MSTIKQKAHKNALKWLRDEFYWSENDPTGPFGSFEGMRAFEGFEKWRASHQEAPIVPYIGDFLHKTANLSLSDYNNTLVDRDSMEAQIQNRKFDDYRNIFSVDVSIIAIVLGQFVLEGKIDKDLYPILYVAIERLMLWNELQNDFDRTCENHIINLYNMKTTLEKLAPQP